MNNIEKLIKELIDFQNRQIPVKKENIGDEDFFKKRKEILKSQNPMEDRKILRNIRNVFGDIIKENFPFYTDYNISFSMCHGVIAVIISVSYYYMGKKEYYDDIVPLNNKYLEKNIRCLESNLMNIRKDMISYPDNEIQRKILKEC